MTSIGFDPFGAVAKAAGGVLRSVKRTVKDPKKAALKHAGTVANVAPAVALAASGGGAGLLIKKGALELARKKGAPSVLTSFADPSGHVLHGAAKGARAGGLKGALKGTIASTREVTRNPLVKATAAGLAFVVPPAGVALSGGIAALEKGTGVADKLVAAYEHGSAPVKKAVAGIYAKTTALAKAGDADAKRALVVLSAAKKKLEVMRGHTYLVAPNGRITRGKFSKVASGGTVGFYVRADGHIERGMFRAG